MVTDGMLTKPETVVKGNYVEKYYRLNEKLFESIESDKQRSRLKQALQGNSRQYSNQASPPWDSTSGSSQKRWPRQIVHYSNRLPILWLRKKIAISYSIFPDQAYDYFVSEMRRVYKSIEEKWGMEKVLPKGNRVVVVALPRFKV